MSKVQQELKLSRLAFVAKYQRNKPSLSHKIIFYCKFGDHSHIAAEEALKLGYRKYSACKNPIFSSLHKKITSIHSVYFLNYFLNFFIFSYILSVRNYIAGYSEWTFKWNEWDDYVDPEKFKQQEKYKEL